LRKPRIRRRRTHQIEAELRSHRPEPRPEFVRAVAARVHGPRGQSRLRIRVALVGALLALVVLAALGGIGYAGSGGEQEVVRAAATFAGVDEAAKPRPAVDPMAASVHTTAMSPKPKKSSPATAAEDDSGPGADRAADKAAAKACRDAVKALIAEERALHKENAAAERERHAAAKAAERARHKAALAEAETKEERKAEKDLYKANKAAERDLYKANKQAEKERHMQRMEELRAEKKACKAENGSGE